MLYGCVLFLWALAVLGSGFMVTMCFAFTCGLLGLFRSDREYFSAVVVVPFVLTVAAWIIWDRRSNFMQRSALAVVERWSPGKETL